MSYDASKFIKYVDWDKEELVLKKDAPESAKKAFEEFKKAQEKAKKRGMKI